MKKFLITALAVLLTFGISGAVMADDSSSPDGGDSSYQGNDSSSKGSGSAIGVGGFKIKTKSVEYGGELSGLGLPNGGAIGGAGSIGVSKAKAAGFVFDGNVEGHISTTGGALWTSVTETYKPELDIDSPYRSFGVRNVSKAVGVTGASLDIKADPEGWCAISKAGGTIKGFTAQGTFSGSLLTDPDSDAWEFDGYTGGLAAQGSLGFFKGGAYASDFRDPLHPRFDSFAEASVGALISMEGITYSESYLFKVNGEGFTTYGMGTNVGALTDVTSEYHVDYAAPGKYNRAYGYVCGGWVAGGLVATHTHMDAVNGSGDAKALGGYLGAGTLGSNFKGAAVGYTATSVTTVDGYNGSIVNSSAGMSVTADVNPIERRPRPSQDN